MASPAQLIRLTNHLRNAYGQKAYDDEDERLGHIIDECSHLPEVALEDIKAIFKEFNQQRLPILFADALKSCFLEWLRKHPEKRSRIGYSNCEDCGGTGLLHFREPGNQKHIFAFQCICSQFGSDSIPVRSKQSLLRDGWIEDSVYDFGKYRVEPIMTKVKPSEYQNYDDVLRNLKSIAENHNETEVPF